MRSKAPLALMEQLVMVLVFALAAALCVQAFALSSRLSQRNEARDHALLQAQNAAETLKSLGGDYAQAAKTYGGTWDGTTWTVSWDETWQQGDGNAAYRMDVTPEESGQALLGEATVTVCDEAGTTLAALPAAWQLAPQTTKEADDA